MTCTWRTWNQLIIIFLERWQNIWNICSDYYLLSFIYFSHLLGYPVWLWDSKLSKKEAHKSYFLQQSDKFVCDFFAFALLPWCKSIVAMAHSIYVKEMIRTKFSDFVFSILYFLVYCFCHCHLRLSLIMCDGASTAIK